MLAWVSKIGDKGMDVGAIGRAHRLGGPGQTGAIAVDEQYSGAVHI